MKKLRQIVCYIIPAVLLFIVGCVVIPITAELENPFIIKVFWDEKELDPNPDTGEIPPQTFDKESVSVRASVFDEYEKHLSLDDLDIFEWYINGQLVVEYKTDTITIEKPQSKGTYWLDIIVGKDTILSSEHVRFTVE
jgi:hypothetical protein